jgi:hypothetical protein
MSRKITHLQQKLKARHNLNSKFVFSCAGIPLLFPSVKSDKLQSLIHLPSFTRKCCVCPMGDSEFSKYFKKGERWKMSTTNGRQFQVQCMQKYSINDWNGKTLRTVCSEVWFTELWYVATQYSKLKVCCWAVMKSLYYPLRTFMSHNICCKYFECGSHHFWDQ